jgi:hypothetical protein
VVVFLLTSFFSQRVVARSFSARRRSILLAPALFAQGRRKVIIDKEDFDLLTRFTPRPAPLAVSGN